MRTLLCALLLSALSFGGVSVTSLGPQTAVINSGLTWVATYNVTGTGVMTSFQMCLQVSQVPGAYVVGNLPLLQIVIEGKTFLPEYMYPPVGPYPTPLRCSVFSPSMPLFPFGPKQVIVQASANGTKPGTRFLLKLNAVVTTTGTQTNPVAPIDVFVGNNVTMTEVTVQLIHEMVERAMLGAAKFEKTAAPKNVIARFRFNISGAIGQTFLNRMLVRLAPSPVLNHVVQYQLSGCQPGGPPLTPTVDRIGADGTINFKSFLAFLPGATDICLVAKPDMTLEELPAGIVPLSPLSSDIGMSDSMGNMIQPVIVGPLLLN